MLIPKYQKWVVGDNVIFLEVSMGILVVEQVFGTCLDILIIKSFYWCPVEFNQMKVQSLLNGISFVMNLDLNNNRAYVLLVNEFVDQAVAIACI